MSKTVKILIGVVFTIIVIATIGFIIAVRNNKYEFNVEKDNEFIKNATYIEMYNSNSPKKAKEKEVVTTLEVDWATSNDSGVKSIKKSKVVSHITADGRNYYLTEKGYVYYKNKKGKYNLLKSKATKIGLFEGKPVVESGKVYYIEIKNGKYVIDKVVNLEVKETVVEDVEVEEVVLPKEKDLNKNIEKKLVFNGREVRYEDGDVLQDKVDGDMQVLYAIYVDSNNESRYYVIASNMRMFVIRSNKVTEFYPDATVKTVLVNSKGIEVTIGEEKLLFEKK